MLRIHIKNTGTAWVLMVLFYLLVLQIPLSSLPYCSYIDEAFALVGVLIVIYDACRRGKLIIPKKNLGILISIAVFTITGLLANVLYRYQGMKSVLIDLFTNLKFFFSIYTGYFILRTVGLTQVRESFVNHARITLLILFMLTLLDYAFEIFESGGTRYGIRVIQLMYGHPTFLSATAAFLVAILTVFYTRENNWYLILGSLIIVTTLRAKAVVAVASYGLLFFTVMRGQRKLRLWQIFMLAAIALWLAWDQIQYYYVDKADESARSMLTITAVQVMKDYFPIGTGFATYGSNEAIVNYSPVYYEYGLNVVYGLSERKNSFASDTFWPIIMGQTGALGLTAYVISLVMLFRNMSWIRFKNSQAYTAGIFCFIYLMISSTSESAFCNPLSIPLAMVIGFVFAMQTMEETT